MWADRARPAQSRLTAIVLLCFEPGNLRSSIGAALLVGTVLFLINQADVVFAGRATVATWTKIGLSYLVPFLVSNYGIVLGSLGKRPGRTAQSLEGTDAD